MGRPPGSRNKPKDGNVHDFNPKAAPESKAKRAKADSGKGHNENGGLTDDQKKVLLLQGVGKIERLQEQMATINADIRNERKRLKADGFEKFEIDFAIQLRRSTKKEDGDAIETDKWRKMVRIAAFLGHPIGTQPDLFDQPDRTPIVDKAFEDGKQMGLEGKHPPEVDGSPVGQARMAGWHEGQKVHSETIGRGNGKPPRAASEDEKKLDTLEDAKPGEAQSYPDKLKEQNDKVDKELREQAEAHTSGTVQ